MDKKYQIAGYFKSPFKKLWVTLNSARALYKSMPEQTTDMKRMAIKMRLYKNYEEEVLFWSDFIKATRRLLRDVEFLAECKVYKRNPVHVAEQVVFLGAKTVEAVAHYGLAVLDSNELLFVDPICSAEMRQEVEQKNTYKKYDYVPMERRSVIAETDATSQAESEDANDAEKVA